MEKKKEKRNGDKDLSLIYFLQLFSKLFLLLRFLYQQLWAITRNHNDNSFRFMLFFGRNNVKNFNSPYLVLFPKSKLHQNWLLIIILSQYQEWHNQTCSSPTYHIGNHQAKVVRMSPATSLNGESYMGQWHVIITDTNLSFKNLH